MPTAAQSHVAYKEAQQRIYALIEVLTETLPDDVNTRDIALQCGELLTSIRKRLEASADCGVEGMAAA